MRDSGRNLARFERLPVAADIGSGRVYGVSYLPTREASRGVAKDLLHCFVKCHGVSVEGDTVTLARPNRPSRSNRRGANAQTGVFGWTAWSSSGESHSW